MISLKKYLAKKAVGNLAEKYYIHIILRIILSLKGFSFFI